MNRGRATADPTLSAEPDAGLCLTTLIFSLRREIRGPEKVTVLPKTTQPGSVAFVWGACGRICLQPSAPQAGSLLQQDLGGAMFSLSLLMALCG